MKYLTLLWLAGLLLPLSARAECRFSSVNTNTSVTFATASEISVASDAAIGSVLLETQQVSPANPPTMTCGYYRNFWGFRAWVVAAETLNYGIENAPARGGVKGDGYTFDTGISGIGYRITHPTDYLAAYPRSQESVTTTEFSVTSGLVLVKTGDIVPGSVIPAGKLGDWRWGGNFVPESFFLANSIKIVIPSCALVSRTTSVTLPSVSTSNFSGVGSTAGTTAFKIDLNCPPGVTVGKITLHTATPDPHRGVILPSGSSTAGGVGIQVLDGNMAAVPFETSLALPPQTRSDIPFYARYFQTGPTVSAGRVEGTATFDLVYQ